MTQPDDGVSTPFAHEPPSHPAPGAAGPYPPAAGYGTYPGAAGPYPPAAGYGAYPAPGGSWPAPFPSGPSGQPLASFGERFGAYLIDAVLRTLLIALITVPLFMGLFTVLLPRIDVPQPEQEPNPLAAMQFVAPILAFYGLLLLLIVGISYVYYVEMSFRSGQTLGKKVLRIRIVPLDPTLTLTRGMAAKRFGVEVVGGMFVPMLPWVDGLWQLWDKPYQQCLHDKAAGTIVVKAAQS